MLALRHAAGFTCTFDWFQRRDVTHGSARSRLLTSRAGPRVWICKCASFRATRTNSAEGQRYTFHKHEHDLLQCLHLLQASLLKRRKIWRFHAGVWHWWRKNSYALCLPMSKGNPGKRLSRAMTCMQRVTISSIQSNLTGFTTETNRCLTSQCFTRGILPLHYTTVFNNDEWSSKITIHA